LSTTDGRNDGVTVDWWVTRGIAVMLAVLGFLPLCRWLPGGEEDPDYARRLSEWGYGTGICVGIAILVVVLSPRMKLPSLRSLPAIPRFAFHPVWLCVAALGLYCWIALSVFSGRPLMIDEVVQVLQAKIFAAGRLWLPVASHKEFFSVLHVVDVAEKRYAQFPPGGPAMLALGELIRATWLVGPVCGAVAVWCFSQIVRVADPDASPRHLWAATALFAVAPFGVFMFGSHMNHGTELMWLMLSVLALARMMNQTVTGRRRGLWAFVNGLALGMAATIRPLDAFAFALPAAWWMVARATRDRREWIPAIVSGVGVAIPFATMLWVNAQTTGAPFLFGYEVLWGKGHGLGFHTSPWGVAHTPSRGVELLSLYVTRLQTYLFETPFPSMLPVIAALALARRVSAIDRYLLASATLLGVFYFGYWHDGFYLGPRFVFPWLPILVLWSARLPQLVRERYADRRISLGVNAALATGALIAVMVSVPIRAEIYRGAFQSMRVNYTQLASAAGVRNALVFVRESWGAQIIARMWAQGVSRNATETFYRKIDACALDQVMRSAETDGWTGPSIESRMTPLMADSSRVIKSPLSTDPTERLLPGATYDASCTARIADDRLGFALMVPLLLERGSGNVYARDLQDRDSLMVQQYPGRPVYLLRHQGSAVDAPFEWLPLRRDSLVAAWRSPAP
jgi:hypothetical protein